ncbi:MAG: hypothetical protein AAF701_01065 [Pseudomonadota bacterium]
MTDLDLEKENIRLRLELENKRLEAEIARLEAETNLHKSRMQNGVLNAEPWATLMLWGVSLVFVVILVLFVEKLLML